MNVPASWSQASTSRVTLDSAQTSRGAGVSVSSSFYNHDVSMSNLLSSSASMPRLHPSNSLSGSLPSSLKPGGGQGDPNNAKRRAGSSREGGPLRRSSLRDLGASSRPTASSSDSRNDINYRRPSAFSPYGAPLHARSAEEIPGLPSVHAHQQSMHDQDLTTAFSQRADLTGPATHGLASQPSFLHANSATSSSVSHATSLPSLTPPASSTTHFATGEPSPRPDEKLPSKPSSPTESRPSTTGRHTSTALHASSTSTRKLDPVLPHAKVERAPATQMYWSRTPTSGRHPKGLRAHTASRVGSNIWCFGGCDLRGACHKDIWKLDCDSFTWTKPKVIGDLPPAVRAHTATVVDDRIWVIGGGDGPNYYNDVYFFDTLCLTWTKPTVLGTPPLKRRAHTAIFYNEQIIVFGGGNGTTALNDTWALDIGDLKRVRWKQLKIDGPIPRTRGYHTFTLVGSKAFLIGGSDGAECFQDIFLLDLERMHWQEVKAGSAHGDTKIYPRLSHSATLVGSYIFMIGGHDGVEFSNDEVIFNLVNLIWETKKTSGIPPAPRGYHSAVLHDSRILLIGGFNGTVFDEVWTLDLAGSAYMPQITSYTIPDPSETFD